MSRILTLLLAISSGLLLGVSPAAAKAPVTQGAPKLKSGSSGQQILLVQAKAPPRAQCRLSVRVGKTKQSLAGVKATKKGKASWRWAVLPSSPSGRWTLKVSCKVSGKWQSASRTVLIVTQGKNVDGPIGDPNSLTNPDGDVAGLGGGECGPFNAPPLKQCTCLAWEKRRDVYDTSVSKGIPRGGSRAAGRDFYVWDGGQWLVNAQRAGFATGSQPVAGALVVWGAPNTASYGHVAYVEQVESPTRVLISECNYDWKGSCRTTWRDPQAAANLQGYIYGGPAGGGPGLGPTPPPAPAPPADSDGDGTPDVSDRCPAVPGPANHKGCPTNTTSGSGQWFLGDGFRDQVDKTFVFGVPGDVPVSGDWDGNGTTTPGVFRGGEWYLSNGLIDQTDRIARFGIPGDVPVAGDWDGDGVTTPGVFRNGTWYLANSFNDQVDFTFVFGVRGDVPVAGDWDGNGTVTPGVFRRGAWFITNGFTDRTDASFSFGVDGDEPVAGDWDADGRDTPGVLRSGQWFLGNSLLDQTDQSFPFGVAGDVAVSGDWNGDGQSTVGVVR